MADEQEKTEEQRRREEDAEHRGAGSGTEAVRRRSRGDTGSTGGAAAYRTGGSEDDGGTGTTGAAEEEGASGGGGDDDEEDTELPQDMFAEGKSEEDYDPDNYNPQSDFPPGDPAKGMPDYNEIAQGVPQYIAMRDYRAYLVSQAVKNERANDEIQAQFVKGMKQAQKTIGILLNPDFQRDKSVEAVQSLMQEPEQWKTYLENFKKQRAAEQKAAAEHQSQPIGGSQPPRPEA